MSYANRKQMSSNRTAAIVIVALIHIALGYALVTGLAYNVIKKAAEDLKTFDVEDEPPPPEEPPPPPEKTETPPPPQIVAPPPIVRTNTVAPPIITTPRRSAAGDHARRAPCTSGSAGPAAAQGVPGRQGQGQLAIAVFERRLSQSAIRDEEQGTTAVRVDDRNQWPRQRLLGDKLIGFVIARLDDLQHP